MAKITALNSESFAAIESLLETLDPEGILLSYFDEVEEMESSDSVTTDNGETIDMITVVMKNAKKFNKDLNKKKYIIPLPTVFKIQSFEITKIFDKCSSKRTASFGVLVKGYVEGHENINLVFVLVGFNDNLIRIISSDDLSSLEPQTNTIVSVPSTTSVPKVRYCHTRHQCPPPPMHHCGLDDYQNYFDCAEGAITDFING